MGGTMGQIHVYRHLCNGRRVSSCDREERNAKRQFHRQQPDVRRRRYDFGPADDGYVLKGLSVNGVPSTELGGSFDESGTVFTVKNWRGALKLEISVTFEKLRTADVEFNLNLHSYRLNGRRSLAAADGTEVMLVGTREYSAEVSGGKVKISGVVEGEYLLKAEGYKPITLAVGEGLADSYMLEYDAIGENAGFDTSKINDGTVKVVTNTWPGDIYLKDSVPANTDFLISALVRHLGEGDIRYGFTAGADLNNDGAYSDAADENIEFIQATLHQSGSVVELSVCNYWVGVNLNDAQLAKFRGEGLRIGFGRIDGKFYMFFDNGGAGMSQALAIPTSNGMTTAELRLGLRAWDNTLTRNIAGLRLEIGRNNLCHFRRRRRGDRPRYRPGQQRQADYRRRRFKNRRRDGNVEYRYARGDLDGLRYGGRFYVRSDRKGRVQQRFPSKSVPAPLRGQLCRYHRVRHNSRANADLRTLEG